MAGRRTLLEHSLSKLHLVPESDRESFGERVPRMIEYAIGRHDWYEDQRGKLFNAALGMLGFVAASVAVAGSIKPGGGAFILSYSVTIAILAFTAIRLIYLYTNVSEKNHPYRSVADIRSWYFRYVVNEGIADNLDELQSEKERQSALNDVFLNFDNFLNSLFRGKSGKRDLAEDLEQVFILFMLQNFRQKNLKEMYRTLKIGCLIFGASGSLTLFLMVVHVSNA